MFYGRGAGAGPTASAVIGDLAQVLCSGRHAAFPSFEKNEDGIEDFANYCSQNYLAFAKKDAPAAKAAFPRAQYFEAEDECFLLTERTSEAAVAAILAEGGLAPLSRIRMLG